MMESSSSKKVPFFLVWAMVVVFMLVFLAFTIARREMLTVPDEKYWAGNVNPRGLETSYHLVGKGGKTFVSVDLWNAGGSGGVADVEITKLTLDGIAPKEPIPYKVTVSAFGIPQNIRFEIPNTKPDRHKAHEVELELNWKSGSAGGSSGQSGPAEFW